MIIKLTLKVHTGPHDNKVYFNSAHWTSLNLGLLQQCTLDLLKLRFTSTVYTGPLKIKVYFNSAHWTS